MYPVPFDIASEGQRLVWLDLVVDLSGLSLDLAPKRFSTAPSWASSPQALRAYLLGRLARWKEIGLTQDQVVHHVSYLVVDMKSCGWGSKAFRHVLFSIRGRADFMELRVLMAALRQVLA